MNMCMCNVDRWDNVLFGDNEDGYIYIYKQGVVIDTWSQNLFRSIGLFFGLTMISNDDWTKEICQPHLDIKLCCFSSIIATWDSNYEALHRDRERKRPREKIIEKFVYIHMFNDVRSIVRSLFSDCQVLFFFQLIEDLLCILSWK